VSTSYYRYLSELEPSTRYEFQVRHLCDQGRWSEYSQSEIFSTAGPVTECAQEFDLNLFTSSINETAGYIYTSQPYGRVNNEFRYRAIGTTDWRVTNSSISYYRYLTGLTPGTDYEFEVRHNCNQSNWSEWSFSHTFRTRGGVADCDPVDGERLYFNAVTSSGAYIYYDLYDGL